MLISELEAKLKELREKHGDLPIESIDGHGCQTSVINVFYEKESCINDLPCIVIDGEHDESN